MFMSTSTTLLSLQHDAVIAWHGTRKQTIPPLRQAEFASKSPAFIRGMRPTKFRDVKIELMQCIVGDLASGVIDTSRSPES